MKIISKVCAAAAVFTVISLAACKAKNTGSAVKADSTTDGTANNNVDVLPPDPLVGLPVVTGFQVAVPALPEYDAAAFASPAEGDLQAVPKADNVEIEVYGNTEANEFKDYCMQPISGNGSGANFVPGMIVSCGTGIPANAAATDAASKVPLTLEITYYDADSNIIGNFDGPLMVTPNQQTWDAVSLTVNDDFVTISKYFTAGIAAAISVTPSASAPAGAADTEGTAGSLSQ